MSGDPMCPAGGICTRFCVAGNCNRMPHVAILAGPPAFSLAPDAALRAENRRLLKERAELRGDVMALWHRLGDVLSLFDGKAMMSAEHQDKLRCARALHALWSEAPDGENGGSG